MDVKHSFEWRPFIIIMGASIGALFLTPEEIPAMSTLTCAMAVSALQILPSLLTVAHMLTRDDAEDYSFTIAMWSFLVAIYGLLSMIMYWPLVNVEDYETLTQCLINNLLVQAISEVAVIVYTVKLVKSNW